MFRRILLPILIFCLSAGNAGAASKSEINALFDALGLDLMLEIMSEEGLDHADELRASMFPGRDKGWAAMTAGIHDTERMSATFRSAFEAELVDVDVKPLLDFFGSELGVRIIDLEVTVRRALLDTKVEEAAENIAAQLRETNPKRFALIEEFIAVNDLIERNVSGGLNASLAFYRGLASGEGFELSEGEILKDVWDQEPDIREESEAWLYTYTTMAYELLNDAELQSYTDLSVSEAGKDLNRSLFAGFDALFDDTSFRLGAAASRFAQSEDI